MSAFDVEGISTNVTTSEIVDVLGSKRGEQGMMDYRNSPGTASLGQMIHRCRRHFIDSDLR